MEVEYRISHRSNKRKVWDCEASEEAADPRGMGMGGGEEG